MPIASKRGRKPVTKKISLRSISHALSGPEQPYPVYPFSRRQFFEKPGHNPFSGIAPDSGNSSWGDSWGTSWGTSWG